MGLVAYKEIELTPENTIWMMRRYDNTSVLIKDFGCFKEGRLEFNVQTPERSHVYHKVGREGIHINMNPFDIERFYVACQVV